MSSPLSRIRIGTFLMLNAVLLTLLVGSTTMVGALNTEGITRGFLVAGGLAALALAVFSSWWLARRLIQPLHEAVAAGRKMVIGDLTASLDGAAAGEVADVRQVLRELKDKLTNIVRDVRSGSIAIEQIAYVIKHDNTELSSRNESNAGALEETAAALEELTATVKNNADNASQANHLVSTASSTAVNGGQVMERVVGTMASIKQSSDKIVDIISVIDGIAFQTNILALNAAVEAARAGEQGRGFAVVASEVRNLAQRSASAAKEIKGLIADSVERVESGGKLVDEAGKAMSEIVTSVKHVAGFMHDIATASQEQSIGITQVNESITQFDNMTQENGKLVESALKSADTLSAAATTLAESVEQFKFGVEIGSTDEAVALVKKCVAFAKENGRQALIDEVNKLNQGRFIYKDLYIVLYDPKCVLLGHGTNRHFVGADGMHSADPDGKLYNQEIVKIGTAKSTGWVSYKFAHPVSQEIKKKSAYVEGFEDISISCGCYA